MKEKTMSRVPKILLIMLGGIGDMVLFTPALKALRQHFPESEITLLGAKKGAEAVIEGEGYVDRFVLLDRKGKVSLRQTFLLVCRMRREKFDLGLAASGINAFNASLMMYLMAITRRVGIDVKKRGFWYTHKVKYDPKENESEGSLRLLESIGVCPPQRYPALNLSQEEKDFIDRFLVCENMLPEDLLIGMHAGSGPKMMDQKRWPKEKFARLADELIRQVGAKVVFTGGEHERELTTQISALMKEKPISAVGRLSLRQTAALVQRCRLFVANDSGIAHVAAAIKTPLIVLFGATELHRIGPRGENIMVLKKDGGLGALTVDEVLESVKKRLSHAAA